MRVYGAFAVIRANLLSYYPLFPCVDPLVQERQSFAKRWQRLIFLQNVTWFGST
jgi:hypothetical protein